MARKILKDERKVVQVQAVYDGSVDNWIKIISKLNEEILEIYDVMYGYSKGLPDEKYQITGVQYSALKDQFNLWKGNLREPDKILENIENEIRRKYRERVKANKTRGLTSDVNKVVEPVPVQKPDATPKLAVFKPYASK